MKITKFLVHLAIIFTLNARLAIAQNDGFEINELNCCRNNSTCNGPNVLWPFNNGAIPDWNASHGTPQINKANLSCSSNDAIVYSGDNAAYLHYASDNKEGIFRSFSIKKNESFTINLFARLNASQGSIVVKLANGLINEWPVQMNPNIPTPSSEQLVISKTLSSGWEEISAIEVIADNDYSQLWIYSIDGSIIIDDVKSKLSCCKAFQVYQSITNPPSTFVNDYILAGRNVSSTLPQGDVVVSNTTTNPTIFQAGNEILLEPGFITVPNANFIARILPCSQTPISINISNISNSNDPCHSKYLAEACYGSGFYTYSWSEDVNNGDNNPATKNIVNGSEWFGKTITVTVTDNITNLIATKSISMPLWLPFVEPFDTNDMALTNAVSPNGDLMDDNWVALDLVRPGTSQWAYNAFRVFYSVYDRYEFEVCEDERIDRTNGMWDMYIFCNGTELCNHKAITYYYYIELENCKEEKIITGTITVSSCAETAPLNEESNIFSNSDQTQPNSSLQIQINPNPFSQRIKLSGLKRKHNFYIYDSNGKLALHGFVSDRENEISNLQYLHSGIYFLHIENTVFKIVKL